MMNGRQEHARKGKTIRDERGVGNPMTGLESALFALTFDGPYELGCPLISCFTHVLVPAL